MTFFSLFLLNFLKYLEITLIFLENFTVIEGERHEIKASLAAILPFLEILTPFDIIFLLYV